MNKKPWYEILGVSPDVSLEEAKKAYLKMVRVYHPDNYAQQTPEIQLHHQETLKEVNNAYDEIKNIFKTASQHSKRDVDDNTYNTSKSQEDNQKQVLSCEEAIKTMVITMFSEYGLLALAEAIKDFVVTENYKRFTRKNNCRDLMREYVSPQELSTYLKTKYETDDIDNAIDALAIELNIDKISLLDNACIGTINKYNYSIFQTKGLLEKLLNGNYCSVTNDGNLRTELQSNVLPKEIHNLIYLALVNIGCDKENFTQDKYAEYITEKAFELNYGKTK